MLVELAANPNVHASVPPGCELHSDPDGRFVVFFSRGSDAHSATVQRVRVDASGVESMVDDIRALLVTRGREGAEWELGAGTEPADLVARLARLGIDHDPDDPVADGMILEGVPDWRSAPGIEVRRAASADELRLARSLQIEAFGVTRPFPHDDVFAAQFEREGIDGATHLAFVDGAPAGAAYAEYTEWGLVLFGGAVVHRARGRGAYRALVTARAEEAKERGTPTLIVHAGQMSRPILERLGFRTLCRIDRLIDVL